MNDLTKIDYGNNRGDGQPLEMDSPEYLRHPLQYWNKSRNIQPQEPDTVDYGTINLPENRLGCKIGWFSQLGVGIKCAAYSHIGCWSHIGHFSKIGFGAKLGSWSKIGMDCEVSAGVRMGSWDFVPSGCIRTHFGLRRIDHDHRNVKIHKLFDLFLRERNLYLIDFYRHEWEKLMPDYLARKMQTVPTPLIPNLRAALLLKSNILP